MKFFVAIVLMAGVALAKPNMHMNMHGGGSSSYSSSNYGGQMQPASNPQMKQVHNKGYGSVTYTAPGQVYTAQPVTYVAPQLTFLPPQVHYNGQSVTYSQPAAEQSGPQVLNFASSGTSYSNNGYSNSYPSSSY